MVCRVILHLLLSNSARQQMHLTHTKGNKMQNIKLDLHETDVEVSFEVSEQFVKDWQADIEQYATTEVMQQDPAQFKQLVDSVYKALTHEQKRALFAEAMELHLNSMKFNSDTGYCYEVSARKHLEMCVTFTLSDYCEEQFA